MEEAWVSTNDIIPGMTIDKLRNKHRRLIYDQFKVGESESDYTIAYSFILEPEIVFRPTVTIPKRGPLDANLFSYVFHLGLVEAISYWKLACPPTILVKTGKLSPEQISWWHDLFIRGLGEFFYTNQIDFTGPAFLTIENDPSAPTFPKPRAMTQPSGDLVLVGGGKDSAVTLELITKIPYRRNALLLNPTPAALAVSKISGFDRPIVITRTIDPKLLKMNAEGYLNGHTPFSAYLAYLSMFLAHYYGYKQVIAANEKGASEGNVRFRNREINHQYSKSYSFEKTFRAYAQEHLSDSVRYFSFLRPLHEIQIAQLFTRYPKYFPLFKSCNVGRGATWCGTCPKCAFTYLMLRPFLTQQNMVGIFRKDLFAVGAIISQIRKLVGLKGHKPFECVGTVEESTLAVLLTIGQYNKERLAVPSGINAIAKELKLTPKVKAVLKKSLAPEWPEDNFVPIDYLQLLRQSVDPLWKNL